MRPEPPTSLRWPDPPPVTARRVIIVIAAVLVLAACAVGVSHAGQPADAADQQTGTAGSPPAPGAQPATLATRTTALGTVATSGGFTVYQFAKDTSNPPASMCSGACAKTWPPVLASDQLALHGVSVAEVGTVTRPDGGVQLTLGGWPVYRYAKDNAPGDTLGQGVGGTWSALAPTGKPIKTAPTGNATAGTTPASGGASATGSCTTTAATPSSGSGAPPAVDPISPTGPNSAGGGSTGTRTGAPTGSSTGASSAATGSGGY